MVFGSNFNLFFKNNKDLSNQKKIETLKTYSTGDMLTLLRNIEESPLEFEEEIIKGVYTCLFDKGIICIRREGYGYRIDDCKRKNKKEHVKTSTSKNNWLLN